MSSDQINSRALGFTVVALSVALEEALKALAEKNGNRARPWLDELEDLALFRAQAHISSRASSDETSSSGEYRLVRMFAMDESAGVVEVPRRAGCVHNGRHGHKGRKEATQALA